MFSYPLTFFCKLFSNPLKFKKKLSLRFGTELFSGCDRKQKKGLRRNLERVFALLMLQVGLDPLILLLIFEFKFKFIDFEKTKFKFIDFAKVQFKCNSWADSNVKFKIQIQSNPNYRQTMCSCPKRWLRRFGCKFSGLPECRIRTANHNSTLWPSNF